MPVPAPTLRDKMPELSAAFTVQLPNNLAEVRSRFRAISANSRDRDATARKNPRNRYD